MRDLDLCGWDIGRHRCVGAAVQWYWSDFSQTIQARCHVHALKGDLSIYLIEILTRDEIEVMTVMEHLFM